MVEVTDEQIWNEKFEEKKKQKMSFENKIVSIGLILFGICIIINSVLIYTFFRVLGKL